MKFSNTIKTVLKIYQKYVKNSVWFGTGTLPFIDILKKDADLESVSEIKTTNGQCHPSPQALSARSFLDSTMNSDFLLQTTDQETTPRD